MKLSELDAAKSKFDKIDELRSERRDFAEILHGLDDDGVAGEVSCDVVYCTVALRPQSRAALRDAIQTSIAAVESDLAALGVEIDEPALFDADDAEG